MSAFSIHHKTLKAVIEGIIILSLEEQ